MPQLRASGIPAKPASRLQLAPPQDTTSRMLRQSLLVRSLTGRISFELQIYKYLACSIAIQGGRQIRQQANRNIPLPIKNRVLTSWVTELL
jgi:hypothetical protein